MNIHGMSKNEVRNGTRTRTRTPHSAAEWFVRVDASGEDALARCEAALCIGKALASDPDLSWAYDEAARIVAGSARRPSAARIRMALANPVLAWSAAAVSSIAAIMAIVALAISNSYGTNSSGRDAAAAVAALPASGSASLAPASSASPASASLAAPASGAAGAGFTAIESVAADSAIPEAVPSAPASASVSFASAAADSAPTIDAQFDTSYASPVVVLPGRVFVDARSVAVMPFGVDIATSRHQASLRAQDVASDVYTDVVERLESIPGIYVAQPVSVLPYAHADLGADQIASQLGVRGIIQGRVAAVADRVRITLSLTDGATDDVVWQGTIERRVDDVASIGADMAANAAAALGNAAQPTFDATVY